MPTDGLVPTSVAAKAIGIARSTLNRWRDEGTVTPTLVTAGGHARWDIEDLREQLRALRTKGTQNPDQAN